FYPCPSLAFLRLAERPHDRPTRHTDSLAPQRVPSVLEMEIAPRGRPRVPADVQKLIVEMATNNLTWGEERIADELLLKSEFKFLLGRFDAIFRSPLGVRRTRPSAG